MSQTVLVPLDGSAMALEALPYALAIANARAARLVLLRIHAPIFAAEVPERARVDAEVLLTEERYLARIASVLHERTGVEVGIVLRADSVARGIATCATEAEAGIIVMSTHGHTALTRFWLGDVAHGVVRHAAVPVLMVRPMRGNHRVPAPDVEAWAIPAQLPRHILVPLDGSEAAESVVAHAAAIGMLASADYTLLHVVRTLRGETPRYPMIGKIVALDQSEHQDEVARAHEYLAGATERLRALAPGASVHGIVSTSESPSSAILEAARAGNAGLIALTTTGHGPARLALGTVAERLLRATEIPLLVYRPAAFPARERREERPIRNRRRDAIRYPRNGSPAPRDQG